MPVVEAAIDAGLGRIAQRGGDGGLGCVVCALQGGGETVAGFGGDEFGVRGAVFLGVGAELDLALFVGAGVRCGACLPVDEGGGEGGRVADRREGADIARDRGAVVGDGVGRVFRNDGVGVDCGRISGGYALFGGDGGQFLGRDFRRRCSCGGGGDSLAALAVGVGGEFGRLRAGSEASKQDARKVTGATRLRMVRTL